MENKKYELMKVAQLADYLKIQKSTAYAWVFQNRIPHIKLNGSLMFDLAEINLWIENQKAKINNND